MIYLMLILLLSQHFDLSLSESFNDIRLNVDKGSWIINASLTDTDTNKKYALNEVIYSDEHIEGKISISSDKLRVDILYSSINPKQRLVIHDDQCDLITYNGKWESKLPGITSSLLNHLLLVGPSVTQRLNELSLLWSEATEAQIRGVTMYGKTTAFGNGHLSITKYYRKADPEALVQNDEQPSTLIFTGTDPSEPESDEKKTLRLDTFVQMKRTDDNLKGFVKPQPGIGCPFYFAPNMQMPQLFKQKFERLHYISDTAVKTIRTAKVIKREEVYIDEVYQQMFTESKIEGKKMQEIYDFNLGIKYETSEDDCKRKPLDSFTTGLAMHEEQGKLITNVHLGFDMNYKFLGIVQNSRSSGRDLYVWEAVHKNAEFEGSKYDRLVATQYLLMTGDKQFTLHSTTVNGYLVTSFNSINTLDLTRVYLKFEPQIDTEDYEFKFNVDQCYSSDSYNRTIELHFNCEGDCDHFKSDIYEYRNKIKSMIVQTGRVSPSRISNIEFIPESNEATAYVTIIQVPKMRDLFKAETFDVDFKQLNIDFGLDYILSEDICLKTVSHSGGNHEAIVYCSSTNYCFTLKDYSSLNRMRGGDNKEYCIAFHVPLKNLQRFGKELSFDQIESEIEWTSLSFELTDSSKTATYSCDRIEKAPSGI